MYFFFFENTYLCIFRKDAVKRTEFSFFVVSDSVEHWITAPGVLPKAFGEDELETKVYDFRTERKTIPLFTLVRGLQLSKNGFHLSKHLK